MGSACTKSNEQQVMQPQTQLEYAINTEFTPFLSITHPFNVNHKYQSFCTYIKSEFTGTGIKKTHAYKAKITKEQILVKRREFWETRVEGNQNSWQVLKQAVESEEKTALAILAAGGLKLVNKSLQIAYDESGHKYDTPIFCINDPISCETEPATEKNLTKNFQQGDLKLIFRCTKTEGKDIELTIPNSKTIAEIKQDYINQVKGDWEKARFFIKGRELMDHHQLGFYSQQCPENSIVVVYLTPKENN